MSPNFKGYGHRQGQQGHRGGPQGFQDRTNRGNYGQFDEAPQSQWNRQGGGGGAAGGGREGGFGGGGRPRQDRRPFNDDLPSNPPPGKHFNDKLNEKYQ